MLVVAILMIFVVLFGGIVIFGAPYVPTLKRDMQVAFDELYPLKTSDVLVDLGSGDGTVLAYAAQKGAYAVGYELNPLLVLFTKLRLSRLPKASVKLANMWTEPLPDNTTVVYVFVVGRDMNRLARRLQAESNRLNRPLVCLSYGFRFKSQSVVREKGAHAVYEFAPLQGSKAQV